MLFPLSMTLPGGPRSTQTSAANRALVALEENSFKLLAAGDREGAYDLLTGSRYLELKAAYTTGMHAALSLLDMADQESTNGSYRQQITSLVAGGLVAALLGTDVVPYIRRVEPQPRPATAVGGVEGRIPGGREP